MSATPDHRPRPGKRRLLALAAVVAGIAVLVFALVSQASAPTPPPSAAGTLDSEVSAQPSAEVSSATASTPQPSAPSVASAAPKSGTPTKVAQPQTANVDKRALPPSKPVSISIPAIKVKSEVFSIGLDKDGALKAPQPGPNLNKVAWFDKSPTPGSLGPSVLEGHVDTDEGRSVFFSLGNVRPGDEVKIKRKDGRTAVFTVKAVRNYGKDEFPTADVYGGDLNKAGLRLITCSNFDRKIGQYTDNLIVFANLTSVKG